MGATVRTTDLTGVPKVLRDFLKNFIWGVQDGAPTDGVTGKYAAKTGALLFDRQNSVVYKNTGTPASPAWNALGGVVAGEITLAEGSILQGNASGVAAALAAGTSGQILVGDGTDLASVAVSGDATLAAGGALTIADSVLEGSNVANVADDNVVGGIPVVHRILLASGADANHDVTLTHKTRIIDAWIVMKGAGTAGSAVTISDGSNTIVTALSTTGTDNVVATAGDTDIARAAEIDDAYQEIAASGTLRVATASTGADFPGAECYVVGLRVA